VTSFGGISERASAEKAPDAEAGEEKEAVPPQVNTHIGPSHHAESRNSGTESLKARFISKTMRKERDLVRLGKG